MSLSVSLRFLSVTECTFEDFGVPVCVIECPVAAWNIQSSAFYSCTVQIADGRIGILKTWRLVVKLKSKTWRRNPLNLLPLIALIVTSTVSPGFTEVALTLKLRNTFVQNALKYFTSF